MHLHHTGGLREVSGEYSSLSDLSELMNARQEWHAVLDDVLEGTHEDLESIMSSARCCTTQQTFLLVPTSCVYIMIKCLCKVIVYAPVFTCLTKPHQPSGPLHTNNNFLAVNQLLNGLTSWSLHSMVREEPTSGQYTLLCATAEIMSTLMSLLSSAFACA